MEIENILNVLKKYYGQNATFREGQQEAILTALNNKRALVVQKTGWGKSLVYFLSTRVLRNMGKGPIIVISPLLSLMNNQIESANKFNLNAMTINSSNQDDWDDVIDSILNDEVDILFISPERLGNEKFHTEVISKIEKNIGLLVVDEAHCISDWGHDFRPDYRRIVNIVRRIPKNIPIIATTATANNRVIDDIKSQLGNDIDIIRGPLTRESISIEILKLNTQAEKLAWLSENLCKLNGTGIIYTLTVGDTEIITKWLTKKGYVVASYTGKSEDRTELEEKLTNNKIKALVATVALGMGFDKPDISFVIHYQKPGNVIAYYQQIGRAGRAIAESKAILMCGNEDDEITNYFINSAFPTEKEMTKVVEIIKESDGIGTNTILSKLNMRSKRLDKILKYLQVDGAIYKEKSKYYPTVNNWKPNVEYAESICEMRRLELEKMNEYINTDKCLMQFIANELDDYSAGECGKCMNCKGSELEHNINHNDILEAIQFLKGNYMIIEPRKKWPTGIYTVLNEKATIKPEHMMEKGLVLSMYNDAGWGKYVRKGKYEDKEFDNNLVEASAKLIKQKLDEWQIDSVLYIPSRNRPKLVKDFAKRLSSVLELPCYDIIIKKEDTPQQKSFENSYYQCLNVIKGFGIEDNDYDLGNVLLIDDMVDSKWTFTYCTYLLRKNGAGNVYPFALAQTSGAEGSE